MRPAPCGADGRIGDHQATDGAQPLGKRQGLTVLDLHSPTSHRGDLLAKMEEHLSNGDQLGWLIDLLEKKVHVYRAGEAVAVLDCPNSVSGSPDRLPRQTLVAILLAWTRTLTSPPRRVVLTT